MEEENKKKYGYHISGGVVVAFILALGAMFLLGTMPDNGEGRVGVPFSEEAQDCRATEDRMKGLELRLKNHLETVDGKWSIYVKDLRHNLVLNMNEEPIYAASLIKLYVMESAYAHMDSVLENAKAAYGSNNGQVQLDMLLENMIVRSDNDSFNELVRLHSPDHSFVEGCGIINDYLAEQGYRDTTVVHTLHPSEFPAETAASEDGALNMTTTVDCGLLLERIYKGECVSFEASKDMLALLNDQEIDTKIPAGTVGVSQIANKTGETDKQQHDVAIVYTKERDYILCIMTTDLTADSESSIANVKGVASLVEKSLL